MTKTTDERIATIEARLDAIDARHAKEDADIDAMVRATNAAADAAMGTGE
ncbi:hypothetical protein AB3Y40_06890 [Yoonia sp. R2331]